MATVPEPAAIGFDALPSNAPEREPILFRFGLRRLFVFLSAATVLSAVLARVGGVWTVFIGLGAALVAAHVLGTFVGTRLRDTSRELQR